MSIPNEPRMVVTGAGSGLGRAFCRVAARRGARVIASDVKLEDARATVELCGASAHAVACDVADLGQVQRLADEAERLLGGVDVVINNAGVAVAGDVGEVAYADWQWIFGVNLWGVIHGCHVFAPRLQRQGSGHIINVASAAGLLSPPHMGPYNVTKAGVVALSETLFGELGQHGVGVSVLCPTFFQTNIARNARATATMPQSVFEKLLARGKLSAEQVAEAALDAAARDELYVLPQEDGRWMWRLKRAAPERYHRLGAKALRTFLRYVSRSAG